MKIYLDTSALQRPLDDKSQFRIRLEAEAVLSLLDLIHAGRLELVTSEALAFEIGRNPHPTRRDFAEEIAASASYFVKLSEEIEQRARVLNQAGIHTLDSLHLASAEACGADIFCTCDDAFLKKGKREAQGVIRVVSPLELMEDLEKWLSQ